MKLGLYGRVLKPEHSKVLEAWISALHSEANLRVEQGFIELVKGKIQLPDNLKSFNKEEIDFCKELDYLISFGGDGTFLDSTQMVKNQCLPILGINTGRMGFLASVDKTDIEHTIEQLKKKSYSIDERLLLELKSEKNYFDAAPYALNEFTIHKKDTSSMITIHTYINDVFLNSYWVDGLIVSTPTGSTGYSLSCGGPIISPNTNNIVITPVAPHNLNVRPIIVPGDSALSFEVEGREDEFLCSLDSRNTSFHTGERLSLSKAPFMAQLVRFGDYDFMETLRTKLGWGSDTRQSQ